MLGAWQTVRAGYPLSAAINELGVSFLEMFGEFGGLVSGLFAFFLWRDYSRCFPAKPGIFTKCPRNMVEAAGVETSRPMSESVRGGARTFILSR